MFWEEVLKDVHLWVKWGQLWEQDLVLLIAVGEGVHVGVVDEGVVAISPGELLRGREKIEWTGKKLE